MRHEVVLLLRRRRSDHVDPRPIIESIRGDGQFCGVLLAGAPGVGKSRLAREALAAAGAQGCFTGCSAASGAVAAIPFGAMVHLLPAAGDNSASLQVLQQAGEWLASPAGGRRRLARYRVFRGGPLTAWTASLERALDEAGDDTAVRAVIMMDQTVAASHAGNLPEAIGSAELILELAERTADKPNIKDVRSEALSDNERAPP